MLTISRARMSDNYVMPPRRVPYIIYMPSLRGNSAGLRVLAKLASMLKARGETVYICAPGKIIKNEILRNYGGLDFLSFKELLFFETDNLHPIFVYPEVTSGNPLGALSIVRYVLGLPGVLGGTKEFHNTELIVGYDYSLTSVVKAELTLRINVLDRSVFNYKVVSERPFTCFYAGKFKSLNGVPFGLPSNSIEIHRSGPLAQTPDEIAYLFSRSSVFYTFEPTLMTVEAAMCGCPFKFIPNHIFESSYNADDEYGIDKSTFVEGQATDHQELAAAASNEIEQLEEKTSAQLEIFIEKTQSFAAQNQRMELFRLIIKQRDGFIKYRSLIAFVFHFIATQPIRRFPRLFRELTRLKRVDNQKKFPKTLTYRE